MYPEYETDILKLLCTILVRKTVGDKTDIHIADWARCQRVRRHTTVIKTVKMSTGKVYIKSTTYILEFIPNEHLKNGTKIPLFLFPVLSVSSFVR